MLNERDIAGRRSLAVWWDFGSRNECRVSFDRGGSTSERNRSALAVQMVCTPTVALSVLAG